jgi:dipeptidyl aminopeptidase/acylaminoacyl peptidase
MSAYQARFARAESFLPHNVLPHIYNWHVAPHWLDGDRFWYRIHTRQGEQTIAVDVRQPSRRVIAAHEHAAWGIDAPQLSLAPGESLSPDGAWAVYAEDHDLWLRHAHTDARVRLTSDGVMHYAWGVEQGGSMTSVSDALAGQRMPPSGAWSPDSRWFLTIRVDERAVADMYLLQHVPPDGSFRPLLHTYRMAMPGDAHFPILTYYLVDVAQQRVIPIDLPPQVGTGESVFYWSQFGIGAPRMWSADGRTAWLHTHSRDQRTIVLYRVDAASGAARPIITETDEFPVYLNPFRFGSPNYRVIEHGRAVIWFSERDGWGHLLCCDGETGAVRHAITRGEGVVCDVLHVDEADGWVYYTACGFEPGRNPYYRHLYRARIDGGGHALLSPEDAEHWITPSPDGRYYIDRFGRLDTPLVTVVRDATGAVVLPLETSDAADLTARGWQPPQGFSATARDGVTPVYGAIWHPTDFDPARRYPVIDMIYGGSQLTIVPHLFPLVTGSPVEANLDLLLEDFWSPQVMAEMGCVVVVIDGMGTPYRGRAFHRPAMSVPGNAGGIDDHVSAIRQLAAQRPYLDLERVGICGHSGGGDNALRAMLRHPDFFTVGVASAGSHEMRAYMAGAGLTDMGETTADYAAHTNCTLVHRLAGRLLLVYGDMDENCHPLHTLRVVDALIAADKDFDLLVLPNRNHAFTTDRYFIRRRWMYLAQHLGLL